jgi:4-hydroxy-tetrahydrodipicolinate synthase
MALGGSGVISVAANVAPAAMVAMCDALHHGTIEEAVELNDALQPPYDLLGSDTNPVPAKWLAHQLGMMGPMVRAPLAIPRALAESLTESVAYAATRDIVAHH